MFQTTNQNILKYMIPLSNQSQCLDGYLKLNPQKSQEMAGNIPNPAGFAVVFLQNGPFYRLNPRANSLDRANSLTVPSMWPRGSWGSRT